MFHKNIRFKEFFRKLHQKKPVQWIAYSFFVLFFPFIGFYAHFIEPKLIAVSKLIIPIKKLPKAFHRFRIVQISDLHFGPTNQSVKFLKKCVDKINHLKPDLVALTGDFVQWDTSHLQHLVKLLKKLTAKFGVLAVLGNHDYGVCHKGLPQTDPIDYEEVIACFEAMGIRVLHNEQVAFQQGEDSLKIVGLGDYWTSHFKPEIAFQSQPAKDDSNATILLCHNPDSIDDLGAYDFSLMLSGHAHGGQISFPFIGPLAVPVKNRHLRRGLHKIGEKWLYTNRGLGYIFKARLLSRPEIACLDLVSETPSST